MFYWYFSHVFFFDDFQNSYSWRKFLVIYPDIRPGFLLLSGPPNISCWNRSDILFDIRLLSYSRPRARYPASFFIQPIPSRSKYTIGRKECSRPRLEMGWYAGKEAFYSPHNMTSSCQRKLGRGGGRGNCGVSLFR